MTTRVRLIRRFPPDERRKPLRDRKRWTWLLRWHEGGGSLPAESIGYYAEARDDWRPTRGGQARLTLKEADRAREKKQAQLEAGTAKPRPSPSARMPWAEFREAYLAETRGTMRDSSLKCLWEAVDIFVQAVSPTTPPDVGATMVKRFVKLQRDKGRSDATVKKHIASLRRIWNDPATDLGKTGNPFVLGRKGLRIRLTVREKEWHRYTSDEIQAVMGACPDLWWRAFIFTAYTTGLRLGELVNLRGCDVDTEALEVHVRPRKDTDGAWGWVPKGKHQRTVPLTGHTAAMLTHLSRTREPANPYTCSSRGTATARSRRSGRPADGTTFACR